MRVSFHVTPEKWWVSFQGPAVEELSGWRPDRIDEEGSTGAFQVTREMKQRPGVSSRVQSLREGERERVLRELGQACAVHSRGAPSLCPEAEAGGSPCPGGR